MEWKLVKSVTGSVEIALPEEYTEISIVLTIPGITMTGNITKSQITTALAMQDSSLTTWILGGAYLANNSYGGAYFTITKTTITLALMTWSGVTYNPQISVLYR